MRTRNENIGAETGVAPSTGSPDAVHAGPTVSASTAPPAAPKRSRRTVVTGIIVIALLAAVGGYLFGPWNAGATRVEVSSSDHAGHAAGAPTDRATAHPEMLHLTPRQRIAADVRTVTLGHRSIMRRLEMPAGIDFDERTHSVITARYRGRIERLFVDQTGRYVRRGAPLMEIYSPELITAQQEYLIAREAATSPLPASAITDTLYRRRMEQRDNGLIGAARKRLALLGMSDRQIALLEERGEIAYSITVYSPSGGTVITRGVTEGAYVSEGTLLIELVDLSTVWVLANVYETEAYMVRPGMRVVISGATLGGATLHGNVDYVYPTVDAASRTVKVRASFANRGGLLRPGMYVTATISLPPHDALVVPVGAVVRTGKRDIVYVEVDTNMFESREIEIGMRDGDYYEVAGGPVSAGDRVVANGGYLLDSETRLGSSASDPHAGMNMEGTKK